MVFGVVRNDDHPSSASRTGLAETFKELMECHGVEPFRLSLENQFSIAQTNSSKVTHALTRRVVQQHRVFLFRRHPHQTTRSILLKMDLIGRPQICFGIGHEPSKFFYMPPELQDRLGRSGGGVCADESQRI